MMLTITNNVNNELVITETKAKLLKGEDVALRDIFKFLNVDTLSSKDKADLADAFKISTQDVTQLLRTYKRNQLLTDNLGDVPDNQYDFVKLILKRDKAKMTFQEMFTIDTPYVYNGTVVSKELLESLTESERINVTASDCKHFDRGEMLEYLIEQSNNLKLKYRDREIEHALTSWIRTERGMLIGAICSNICYNKHVDAEAEWDRFIASITDVKQDQVKVVLKHFIWQVKRKLFNKSVKYHMMPILYGAKQGSGKSTTTKNFMQPLKDFVAWTDFSSISDNRDHKIWSNSVLVFDEMGNSTTSNLEIIKQRLTSDTFTSRKMNTNGNITIVNKTTSFGTTNKDLTRMIFDESGMRRFYQIDFKSDAVWTVLADIDYEMLWRSIDENSETPLLKDMTMFNSILEVQAEKRFITLIEEFLLQRNYPAKGEKLAADLFFIEFQNFEKIQTPRPEMTATKFGRDVLDISKQVPGLSITKVRTSKGMIYNILKEDV